MKKIILIAGVAVVLLAGGVGGAFFFLSRHHATATHKPPPKPKPLLFAQLPDIVVTVPATADDSTPTYVQISLQFSTTDPDAITAFTNLEPIIKAQTITLLMGKTAKTLMDPTTHDALGASCLGIVNQVLDKSASFTPRDPFSAAYITNLVEQN